MKNQSLMTLWSSLYESVCDVASSRLTGPDDLHHLLDRETRLQYFKLYDTLFPWQEMCSRLQLTQKCSDNMIFSPALVSAQNIVPRDLQTEFWVTGSPWVYWRQSRKSVNRWRHRGAKCEVCVEIHSLVSV